MKHCQAFRPIHSAVQRMHTLQTLDQSEPRQETPRPYPAVWNVSSLPAEQGATQLLKAAARAT